ncbi:hypothetical protein GTA09_21090 [Rhodococcus hoagii]|nr:hypothetical protein [Prescottella equi]
MNFVEKGNRVAFTGTIIDGVIRTLLEAVDDTLGAITYPILGEDRAWNQYLQKAAGTLPGLPLALYRTGEYTNVSRVEQMTHIPLATRVTGGGKSPNWMNDLVVNAGNFIVGAIGAAFNIFGLSLGVLSDQLKDRIMAFHTREDFFLAREAGPLRFHETFVSGQGTGLSLDLMAAMSSTAWDHRGYTSAAIEVTNGAPHYIAGTSRRATRSRTSCRTALWKSIRSRRSSTRSRRSGSGIGCRSVLVTPSVSRALSLSASSASSPPSCPVWHSAAERKEKEEHDLLRR